MATLATRYETIVGIEVHTQLDTRTKMYCACPNRYGDAPNTHVCPICLGWPGTLPTVNAQAVALGIKVGLALGCTIRMASQFARKNYFYPDLPKGYQITQYQYPIAENGALTLRLADGTTKDIRIIRAHLEEDTAKLLHFEDGETLLDHNRAGVPLMEIVSAPDIRSAEEAEAYLRELQGILRGLGASQANMEQGQLRCEPNISIRPEGSSDFLQKTEVKNINSFSQVGKAIAYEATRQAQVLERVGASGLRSETRGFDERAGQTFVMRVKESQADYRYFPEPDLPPLVIDPAQLEALRAELVPTPLQEKTALMQEFALDWAPAALLVEREADRFFREAVELGASPREAAIWLTGETYRLMNESGRELAGLPIQPALLAELIAAVEEGTISKPQAKEVWEAVVAGEGTPGAIIATRGLAQISDTAELDALIDGVLDAHAPLVAQYLAGKEALLGALVGKTMQASGGQANPKLLPTLIKARLEARRS